MESTVVRFSQDQSRKTRTTVATPVRSPSLVINAPAERSEGPAPRKPAPRKPAPAILKQPSSIHVPQSMRNLTISAFVLLLAAPLHAEKLYVHVTALEEGGRATVEMTLPMAFVKNAAEILADADLRGHCSIEIDDHDFNYEDIRAIARAVRDGDEATIVGSNHEELRIRRIGADIEIVADDRWDRVVTRVPADLFMAAFQDERRVDFAAALEILSRRGGGEILVSTGDDGQVRVWIDRDKAIRGGVR